MTTTAAACDSVCESWKFVQDSEDTLADLQDCLGQVRTFIQSGRVAVLPPELFRRANNDLLQIQRDLELIKHSSAVAMYQKSMKAVR